MGRKKACEVCAKASAVSPDFFQHQGKRATCVLNAANHCMGRELLTVEDMERHRAKIYKTECRRMKASQSVHKKRSTPGYWTLQVLHAALQEKGFQLKKYKFIKTGKFFKKNGPAWRNNFLFTYVNEHSTYHMVSLRGPEKLWFDSVDTHAHMFPASSWDAIHNVECACKYSLEYIHRIVPVNK